MRKNRVNQEIIYENILVSVSVICETKTGERKGERLKDTKLSYFKLATMTNQVETVLVILP